MGLTDLSVPFFYLRCPQALRCDSALAAAVLLADEVLPSRNICEAVDATLAEVVLQLLIVISFASFCAAPRKNAWLG